MKNDQYFNLEVNMFSSDDLMAMMFEMNSAEAVGIYVLLLLHLRTKDEYEGSCKPVVLKGFAHRHNLKLELVERVLRNYNLFVIDEERQMFRSPYMDRVMKALENRRKIDSERGKKGGRPRKDKSAETLASKEQKPNEKQKSIEEESKEEKNKGITTVEYNSSNTRAEKSAAVDDVILETTVDATDGMTDASDGMTDSTDGMTNATDESTEDRAVGDLLQFIPQFTVVPPTSHSDSPHVLSQLIPRLTGVHPTPRSGMESAYSLPLKLNTFAPQFISGKDASGANSPNTEEPEPLMEAYAAP